jgi:hypothetical protein
MRQAVAIGVGVAVVVAGLVVLLSHREEHLAVTNSRVVASAVAVPVRPGEESCAPLSFLPTKVESARVYAGTYGAPGSPLELIVRANGRIATTGHVAGGYRNGPLTIPIRPPRRELVEPEVCLRNAGSRRVRFAGNVTPLNAAAAQGRGGDRIRFDFIRPGRESWFSLSPTIADRFAMLKPTFVGPWTMWALFGVVALLWAGAIVLVRRESR